MRNIFMALSLLGFTGASFAEGGCPPGQYPYETPQARQCVPIPNGPSSQPSAVWKSRWGAVAADGPKGILGVANGESSKRSAEKKALADCKGKGGACQIEIAYRDQCAVLVSGDKRYLLRSAESIEVASQVGLRDCNKEDVNCKVHYSGCSYPERVQ